MESIQADYISNQPNKKISTITFKLNPFFRVQFKNPIILDLLLEGTSVELPDSAYLKLLATLGEKSYPLDEIETFVMELFSVKTDSAKKIIEDLTQNKVLVAPDYRADEMQSVEHWIDRGWSDALILHLRTRNIKFSDNKAKDPDTFNANVMRSKLDNEGPPEIWSVINGETIALPSPTQLEAAKPFQEAILHRRTHWKWRGTGMRLAEIADILYYGSFESAKLRKAAELNLKQNPETILNSAFSAIETYLFVFNIDALEPGMYHYNLQAHHLTFVKKGLFQDDIAKMCIGQQRPAQADCALVLTTKWKRYMYRYNHPRAYRTLLINTAELAQKYITLASAYGLVAFLTPAFEDQYADKLLEVNGYEEAPAYLLAFG